MTGVGQEKNGVKSFFNEDRLVGTWDIKIKTYPEYLSERGYRVGVMNFPVIYPPLRLKNGFCISGQLTPVGNGNFFYPPHLKNMLNDYEIDVQYGRRPYGFVDDKLQLSKEQLKKDIFRVGRRRMDAALKLMKEDWDLFSILIKGTDVIQHCFWSSMIGLGGSSNIVLEFYKLVDWFFGKILENNPKSTIVILSDHGFGARRMLIVELWAIINKLPFTVLADTLINTRSFRAMFNTVLKLLPSRGSGQMITGDHEYGGIWMAKDERIKEDFEMDTDFLDITPLILCLMGTPIPRIYKGKVVKEIFKDEVEIKYVDDNLSVDRTPPKYKETMRKRLSALGYVEMVEK